MTELLLKLDLIYSKIGYILACLTQYSSLDLSKRIQQINQHIYLIKKSIKEDKEYVDVRNVIELREQLTKLETRLPNDDEVSLDGHKIACLLFEASIEIKMLVIHYENINEDMKEYLLLTSKYLYDSGRIVNIEILCYDNKLD